MTGNLSDVSGSTASFIPASTAFRRSDLRRLHAPAAMPREAAAQSPALPRREVQEPLVCCGDWQDDFVQQCRDLALF